MGEAGSHMRRTRTPQTDDRPTTRRSAALAHQDVTRSTADPIRTEGEGCLRSCDPKAARILIAGTFPGSPSGNAVSSEVLSSALEHVGEVTQLGHRMAFLPSWHPRADGVIELGTQPFVIHGEGLAAGLAYGRRLSAWTCGWAVNSRYAGALMMSRLPYAIWEATLIGDEMESTSIAENRLNGRGTGIGVALHSTLLPVGERIEGLLYRKATILCAMSDYTRSRMIERYNLSSNRVLLLSHPPTFRFLQALKRAGQEFPGPAANGGGPVRLLCVGRVDDPRKGVAELLQAVVLARSAGLSISLTVVGPYSEKWARRFAALISASQATLLGKVDLDELARQYLSHSALVVPSRQEGFGIVVAEAFHAGLPVIATRCGGPEAAIRSSGAGMLTEREPAALAAAFQIIVSNPSLLRELSANAARFASAELSPAAFACRVREITGDLIARARAKRSVGVYARL